MLNPKQKRFCEEYVIDLNGTQAAIRAGYSRHTAHEKAAQLLAKVSVKAEVARLQAEITERNKLKADDVINELRALAFWDVRNFIQEDNSIVSIKGLDHALAKPITGIKVKKTDIKVEGVTIGNETTTELKLADKRAALVDLGRHLGIFKEDNNQKTIKIKVTRK